MFAVFKKYHSVLLDNFPENYMTSLEILYQTYPFTIPSKTIEYITAPASYKAVNQRILELLINLIMTSNKQDYFFTLVTILERIVGMFESNVVLKRFDDGMLVSKDIVRTYVCICMYSHVCISIVMLRTYYIHYIFIISSVLT